MSNTQSRELGTVTLILEAVAAGMRSIVRRWMVLACLLVTGCAATMRANTDFDRTIDFWKYLSFSADQIASIALA
jgi:hypothetical protein